jgi:transposase
MRKSTKVISAPIKPVSSKSQFRKPPTLKEIDEMKLEPERKPSEIEMEMDELTNTNDHVGRLIIELDRRLTEGGVLMPAPDIEMAAALGNSPGSLLGKQIQGETQQLTSLSIRLQEILDRLAV